jgi:hypothetical protein
MESIETQVLESDQVKPTIEVIKDYTIGIDSPVILVNPAHGNEPYILGTAFAQGVSNKLAEAGLPRARIVVPLLYGDRQRNILLEENPENAELIYFDEEFGKILEDITFRSGNFSEHLRQVNSHYDKIEQLLKARFSSNSADIDVRSLVANETHAISPQNIVASIDTAPRVSVEVPNRYFAFPILVSEILKSAQNARLGFEDTQLAELIKRMLKVESAYSQIFIPFVNPLSYNYSTDLSSQPENINGHKMTFTPAMKRELEKTTGKVSEPGIYAMFSGTGSAETTLRSLVESAEEAGLKVYTPPWVDVEGAAKISPDILTDENILAVFGRSGWGTGWQAQNLALPWIVTPYETGDDPEIYFNNKTVEALGIGRVLKDGDITPKKLTEIIGQLSVGVQRVNGVIKDKFGTLDGIDFVSSAIAEDFLSKK